MGEENERSCPVVDVSISILVDSSSASKRRQPHEWKSQRAVHTLMEGTERMLAVRYGLRCVGLSDGIGREFDFAELFSKEE